MRPSDVSTEISAHAVPADRTTPLRELALERVHDCRVLTPRAGEYSDGSEERILEILTTTEDLSSTSDELSAQARTWPERYHLDTARANVLRPLAWSATMSVLEIGAGCGAITRFLAETGALVDALEPAPARARCARQRTAGLAGVEVFVGDLRDVPATPVYDVVVVVGVLEYVDGGGAERAPYLDFLRRAADLLRDGGNLVLAIENQLGVKYLCGAPEDHSGRAFDSVEGYPWPGPARTFSRRDLESFLRGAGLSPTVLGVFPDYKLTRLVYSDGLLEVRPDLVRRIPQFPSPDWQPGPPRVVDEARAWASLVDGGLAAATPNSFLAVAQRDDSSAQLWRGDLLAAYYPPAGRRATYSLETLVRHNDGTILFERRALRDPPIDATIKLEWENTELIEGDDLLERMASSADESELRWLLEQWSVALDRELQASTLPGLDLLPHNAVLGTDGKVTFVDAKWRGPADTREVIVRRAALLCGLRLAWQTPPWRWPAISVEGLVLHIGWLLGLPRGGDWLPAAIDYEAAFQAEVTLSADDDPVEECRSRLKDQLALPLAACRPVPPPPDVQGGLLESELAKAAELVAEERSRTSDVEHQLAVVTAEMAALCGTKTFLFSQAMTGFYERIRSRAGRPS